MQTLWAGLLFLFASGYVLFLDYFALSSRGLQKSLVLPLLILLFILYRVSVKSWSAFLQSNGKWFLFLWGTILIQTLVVSTGGLQSPFLVLIHLSMIALSFLIGFGASVIFLLLSFGVLIGDISFNQNVITFLTANPGTIVLQLVSLLSIIPLAYVISQQYHIKDMLTTMLTSQVKVDQAILESLDELIIVTDSDLTILSVNDAVEQTLQKSRSELINKPLFSTLLLKKKNGTLATKELFFPDGNTGKEPAALTDEFTIINSPPVPNTVTIQTQTIKNDEANIHQLSFILSFTHTAPTKQHALLETIEKARAKYDALSVNLTKKLLLSEQPENQNQMLLLEKIERDIYYSQILTTYPRHGANSRIDLAKLCELLVYLEKDFAKLQHVELNFSINNFGEKDIAPLTVENFHVEPRQLTGPFFTVPCDVKSIELMIKKLLDICVFLASGTENPNVKLELDRKGDTSVFITVIAGTTKLNKKDLSDIYLPNYGKLYNVSNLHAGSGLEGFLVNIISNQQGIPVAVHYKEEPTPQVIFTITMKKAPAVKSKRAR